MNKPFVIHRGFATSMTFVFLLLTAATFHNDSLKAWQTSLNQKQEKSNALKTDETEATERSRLVISDSKIALSRASEGCAFIQLTQNNKPARFQETMRVFDAQTFPDNPKLSRFDKSGNPINGVLPMPQGVTVCNEFGDTAIVGTNGNITEIKRVQPSQKDQFKQLTQPKKAS